MMVMSVPPVLAAFAIKENPIAAFARPSWRLRIWWALDNPSIGRQRFLAIVRQHNS
jgi:hypothetical protein